MSDDKEVRAVASQGPRWGFMVDGRFVNVPKVPLLLQDLDRRPPFDITLPGGQVRRIVEEPTS